MLSAAESFSWIPKFKRDVTLALYHRPLGKQMCLNIGMGSPDRSQLFFVLVHHSRGQAPEVSIQGFASIWTPCERSVATDTFPCIFGSVVN